MVEKFNNRDTIENSETVEKEKIQDEVLEELQEMNQEDIDILSSDKIEIQDNELREVREKLNNIQEDLQMNEVEESEEYSSLKEKFLADRISTKELYNGLVDLDQKYPDRRLAKINIDFLSDLEVKNKIFESKNDQVIMDYYLALAFAKWHYAQIKLFKNSDVNQVIKLIQESIADRAEIIKIDPEILGEDSDYYALATMAYLKKDLESLEKIYSKMTQDENHPTFCNTKIVAKFISGLKERGDIDYIKDYSVV